jgi:DNA-binding NarL/FixJ family response regulator
MPADEPFDAPLPNDDKALQRQAFYDRLDDLVRLTRYQLRRVRRLKAAGLLTDDIVHSALASAIEAGAADADSTSSAEENDLVWIAIRRALGRKIYKYFHSPTSERLINESQMPPDGEANWLFGLAKKEITERDVAGCFAMRREVLEGLKPDERLVAELLLLGYSAREIGESSENQFSYSQVRRLVESIRAHFEEHGFNQADE